MHGVSSHAHNPQPQDRASAEMRLLPAGKRARRMGSRGEALPAAHLVLESRADHLRFVEASRRAVLGRNGRSRHGDLLEREFPAVLSARQLVRQPSPAMPITLTIKTTGGQQAQVGEYAPSQCIARGRERRESPAVRGPGRVVPRCLKPCLCRCRRRTRIRWWTSRTRLNARLSSVASSEGFPHIQHSMRGPVPMNAPGRR